MPPAIQKVKWILAVLTGLVSVCACTGKSASQEGEKPLIVATTGMIGDIVKNIAAEQARVSVIIGPGVDPHLYTATRDDVAEMMRADLIFYNGLLLEGRMSDTLIRVGRGKPVYAVTEQIDKKYLLAPPGFGGHHDPHVWMDVSAWSKAVEAVAEALVKFDPSSAAYYRQNTDRYQKKLAALHEYGRKRIATIPGKGPKGQPVMITSHDAFNYLGRAYGLDVYGVQGISTESESGLQRINTLVDLIVKYDVPATFVESSVSPKNIQALVQGARATGHDVEIGGELFSDAMGSRGTYEGTYIGMIDHNLSTITRALGGEAPRRGMYARLSVDE
jgi:manganese/zinc/iron transport system substrate-binding protein